MITQKRPLGRNGIVAGLVAAITLTAVGAVSAQQSQRYELSGQRVAVYNLAGEVTVQPGSGSAVVVEVRRGGPDAGQLAVETGRLGDTQALRVIYPDYRIVYAELGRRSRTELRVREDGTFGDGSDDRRGRSRGDRVTIASYGEGLEAHADLTISVPSGQRVAVYLAVGEASVTNVEGTIRIDTRSAPVTTSGTSGSLDVDVGSGHVDVRNAEGYVNIDTGSGSIEVSGVSGSSLLLDTGSGSVTASDISVADLDIDTGSGRIRAERVSASNIRLDTGSGSVDLEVIDNPDRIEIDTGAGGVTLTVPESYGAHVEIETGSGGIDLDMPLTMRSWRRDHVIGTIGDGEGRLTIDTGSGSVTIRRGR